MDEWFVPDTPARQAAAVEEDVSAMFSEEMLVLLIIVVLMATMWLYCRDEEGER